MNKTIDKIEVTREELLHRYVLGDFKAVTGEPPKESIKIEDLSYEECEVWYSPLTDTLYLKEVKGIRRYIQVHDIIEV